MVLPVGSDSTCGDMVPPVGSDRDSACGDMVHPVGSDSACGDMVLPVGSDRACGDMDPPVGLGLGLRLVGALPWIYPLAKIQMW